MALVPADQPLYAYRPDETLRGAVPFYTGHYLVESEDTGNVVTILQKPEPFFIVIRDQNGRLEKELLSSGELYILVKQEMGMGRPPVGPSNKAQSTLTIPYPLKKKLKDRSVSSGRN
jgi:hypothetical protein